MKKERIGSTLESMFEETGEWDEVQALAQKKIIAHEIEQAMKQRKVSPAEMARRMGTSRTAVYRLLDPGNAGVTLESVSRAAVALKMTLQVRLVGAAVVVRRSASSSAKKSRKATAVHERRKAV